MKKDAHYYAVLGFCRACGFRKESAHQVAYASQFVDDAKINHIALLEDPGTDVEHDIIEGQPSFFNMATCHSYTRMKTFNYNSMIANTCAFHFVPGCKGELFAKKLRCSDTSPVIRGIMEQALEENDLAKLGMVLHPFADSFSHQGFSGLLSKVNDIQECNPASKIPWGWYDRIKKVFQRLWKKKFDRNFDALMPAYGHGQAIDYPDLPYLTWSYEYDYSDQFTDSYKFSGELNNKERYQKGFEEIRQYLEEYLVKHPQYHDDKVNFQDFNILFAALVAEKRDKCREENWRKILIDKKLFESNDPELNYDSSEWLREAFSNFDEKKFDHRKVERVRLDTRFSESNWYKYYLAVKWYKAQFFKYCAESNLKIPR